MVFRGAAAALGPNEVKARPPRERSERGSPRRSRGFRTERSEGRPRMRQRLTCGQFRGIDEFFRSLRQRN
jgi:hypothetical protein